MTGLFQNTPSHRHGWFHCEFIQPVLAKWLPQSKNLFLLELVRNLLTTFLRCIYPWRFIALRGSLHEHKIYSRGETDQNVGVPHQMKNVQWGWMRALAKDKVSLTVRKLMQPQTEGVSIDEVSARHQLALSGRG